MYKDLQVPMYFEGWDEIRIVRDEDKKEKKQEVDLKERYLNLSIKDYENILSEIDEKNIDMPQDNSHHTLSMNRHMYFAYDYIKEQTDDKNLIIAALMYDVGKAYCKTFHENSRYASFKKHENVSAQLTINYLFDSGFEKEDIIDIATLVQLHMAIMRNENGEEGIEKLKNKFGIELFERIKLLHDADTQNWIGTRGAGIEGAIFIPPVPGDIIESLANLYEYMNDEFIDPLLVNTAIVHAQFETIHAYKDGNGRFSRTLIPIQMAYLGQSKRILYLSEIIKLIFMPYKV
ncbi:MAG: Fic family protein [Sarcina sp.]